MKKRLLWCIAVFIAVLPVYAAEIPDAFQVEVKPSSFSVNQPVDITIKAIKNNQIMKNYVGGFYMTIAGQANWKELVAEDDYTLPSLWFDSFALTDQGVKTFSKWLKVAKPGSFSLVVEDLITEKKLWTATLIVKNDQESLVKNIALLSPVAGVNESKTTLDILAQSQELTNARMQIFLNDLLVKEGTSDASGLLSETIDGLKVGTNYVQIKALSLAGEVVWLSDKVIFTYSPQTDQLFKDITANPNSDIKLWDKVHFEIFSDESVSSAKLILSGGKEYPLDKEKDWLFSKDVQMTQTGDVIVNILLSAGVDNKKNYENVYQFFVKDNTQIGQVQVLVNKDLGGALQLSWEVIGAKSDHYAIKYGLQKDDLKWMITTTGESALLSWLTYGKEYFFQVYSTNSEHKVEGLPSEIISYKMPIAQGNAPKEDILTWTQLEPEHPAAPISPTCVLKNIKVSTEKIGKKYYLVWKSSKNISKYLVYKSDFSDWTNKTFLWETKVPRFEYPFDAGAEENVYAYYSVEAVCDDWTVLSVADAKKVQVGPLEDMLLIFTSTMLIYLLYRLYYYAV